MITDEQRLALLDEAIAAFRSILIRQPGTGARAPGTGPGLLSQAGTTPWRIEHFERALVGQAARGPVISNINGVSEMSCGRRRRWTRVFRVLRGPGYQYQRRLGRGSSSISTACRFAGVQWEQQASSDIGVVGWGGAEYQYPAGRPLAPARGVRRQPPGVSGGPVRPDLSGRLRGAALVASAGIPK